MGWSDRRPDPDNPGLPMAEAYRQLSDDLRKYDREHPAPLDTSPTVLFWIALAVLIAGLVFIAWVWTA